jgi:2-keto-4-pentenoate hydratase/2-oxohepta-3-ene-1,7-dioic acid hydratase in catechol pathway
MLTLPLAGTDRRVELRPSKIVAVGLNYREHIAESLSVLNQKRDPREIPPEPVLFAKTPNVLIGPGESIPIPSSLIARYGFAEPRTDHEAELAVIIGARCRDVGPIGPVIVPREILGDAGGLAIECRLNGKVAQRARTSDMIFGVRELVSFISRNFTLEPGDIIATGTPSGVGPLRAGDFVEVEIEGIGVLGNPVVEV